MHVIILAPLLVVLHGDREPAATAGARWQAAAKDRGWLVLPLACPTDLGCKGKWWEWGGATSWLRDRVDDFAKSAKVDRDHVYLAGWSGGASFIGLHAQDWAGTFAGVVLHGGGLAPSSDACPTSALPAYFLVGDANPLHHLAIDARRWFERCKQPIVWDLIPKGDHDREDRALDRKKAAAILDWLYVVPAHS